MSLAKLTASLPLKMDGWKMLISFLGPSLFQGWLFDSDLGTPTQDASLGNL